MSEGMPRGKTAGELRAEYEWLTALAAQDVRDLNSGRSIPAASSPAHGWPSLRWTEQKPKRSGWWWVETKHQARFPIWVSAPVSAEVSACVQINGRLYDVASSHFVRWAGPLVEPEEASDAQTTANARISDAPTETSR